jgi:hypothetical protein
MFDSIQLTNIDTLRDLSNSFKRFGHKTEEYLQALEAELKRTLESMQARVRACQQKVAQKQWEAEQARDALENCRSYEDDDYQPDCSGEEDELRQAIREFETAKRNFETVKILYSKVENAVSEFHQHIRRLRDLATTNVNRANAYLENKTAILESYRNVRPESVNPLAINSESASSLQSNVITTSALSATTSLANVTTKELSDTSGQWVETRLHNFDLSILLSPEYIQGAGDFQKVKLDEMQDGLKKLQEMKPVIEQGVGNSKDYWSDIDKKKGLDYPNGYQRVYEAFYGAEPIRIIKDGDKYDITNGRHRIWAAKQLGIKTLPLVLVERK